MKFFMPLFLIPFCVYAPIQSSNFICSYNLYLFTGEKVQFKKIEQTLNSVSLSKYDNFLFNFQEILSEKGAQKIDELLIASKKIKIINQEIPLITASTNDFPFKLKDRGIIKTDFRRSMLYSEFVIDKNRLIVINCHWPSQFHSFEMRIAQAKTLRKFIFQAIQKSNKLFILVTGDFNLKKNEIKYVEKILAPYLHIIQNRGTSPGTFYYSKKAEWNTLDLMWTNFELIGLHPKIIVVPTNSTLAKNKNGEFFLRPKKFYRAENHFDRQGPSDHFPICMKLPFYTNSTIN